MNVVLFSREYPPDVYGGAGVHVEYLSRELARLARVRVRTFGAPRERPSGAPAPSDDGATGLSVEAFPPWEALAGAESYMAALRTISVDLAMANGLDGADLVHSHTWYTNLAGHLAKLAYGIPHVMTSHSLEPLRPWKAEQLGTGGYALSSFCERTAIESADAVIAVSQAARADVLRCYPSLKPARLHVIHNGVDPNEYRLDPTTDVLEALGIRVDRPVVLFVGRIARQKGIFHLVNAARDLDPRAQLVLAAAAPDTLELEHEMGKRVAALAATREGVVWIERMLGKREVIQLLSHATVFVCPSIYEPLGIVNLEAMACETAVVATAVGGIPEVVADSETGVLVPFEPVDDPSGEPKDPERYVSDLGEAINSLIRDPERAQEMGRAGRQRAVEHFDWKAIARRTYGLYESLVAS